MMFIDVDKMESSLFILLGLILPFTTGVLRKSSECSESLGCITNPEGTIMLTWQPTSQHVHLTLRGYIGAGDLYVAMGLSHDEIMGNDDVTECVHVGGRVRVLSSYNSGHTNKRFDDGGLFNQSGIYENGTIECSFTRLVNGSDVFLSPRRHNLNQSWHVLLVWGHLMSGTDIKMQHAYVSTSPNAVSLLAVGSFETQRLSALLIHIHGSLMMIAWVALTSVGVIISRHYKGLLSGREICGKQVWFQVHRAMMAAVVILTMSGIAVIFVEVGGYKQGDDMTNIFPFFHPILGLVVTGLSILNPLIALCRPRPTARSRPVFNWAHRSIGTLSHLTAVVTIFFGLKLPKVDAQDSMLLVLGAFVAWHVAMEIIFFCIVCVRKHRNSDDKRRDSGRKYSVQEKQEESTLPKPPTVSGFQELLLMLHSAVAIATVIFLLALLLLPKHGHDH